MVAKKPAQWEVMESMYSLIALVFILVTCVELGDAATAVDVYRLIQYDISGVPFGSRLSRLNHHAASMDFAAELDFKARLGFRLPTDSDLSRTVLVLPLRDLSVNFVKGYVSEGRLLGGLLFLLPPILSFEDKEGNDGSSQPSDSDLVESILLKRLERLLIDTNIPYPVYFAFEDHNVKAVLADIKRTNETLQLPTATTGGYKLVVSVAEPKKVASPIITNIQGWLPGLKAEGDSSQLPTIAIVASYDTFGAAPALSVGSDSNGNGVVALLELARLFSLLYSNPKTRGRYNLLFGLTSGGPYNYDGTSKWLRSFDQRLRESIDYAICLNSVGSGNNELFLHVSKPPENAYIKQIFEGLSSVAGDLDIKVGLKHKKINISDSRVAWEHEQFSRLRITAATLSELSTAPRLLESTGGLSDVRHFTSETAVVKSVKLVAESLARHIYGHEGKNIQIFADNSSLAVNPSYIRTWMDVLSRTPRVAPFLAKNDPLVMALKKELAEHTEEATLQTEVLDEMFTFYDSTKAKLNIYQVASVSFDFLLLLALGSYLIVLFSFLVITTRGVDDLISLFRRPPTTRKAKSA